MAAFAMGRASRGRSLQGGVEYVKKSPEQKVVEVVKVSAASPSLDAHGMHQHL